MPDEDHGYRLAYAAAQDGEATAARLLRTQLLGALILAAATFGAPTLRIVTSDDDDLERSSRVLSPSSAIGYLSDHAHDHSEHAPKVFTLVSAGLVATMIFAVVAVIVALVLATKHTRRAQGAVFGIIIAAVAITLFNLFAPSSHAQSSYADLQPTWMTLLPLALGLWTANILRIED